MNKFARVFSMLLFLTADYHGIAAKENSCFKGDGCYNLWRLVKLPISTWTSNRFLQFLRSVDHAGTLENLLSLLADDNRDAVRPLLQQLRGGGEIGMIQASVLPPAAQGELLAFMNNMHAAQCYAFGQTSIPISNESSDDSMRNLE
jgi:hypothetical protein